MCLQTRTVSSTKSVRMLTCNVQAKYKGIALLCVGVVGTELAKRKKVNIYLFVTGQGLHSKVQTDATFYHL